MQKSAITALILVLAGNVWAFDPSGNYSFKEKGMSGSMEVKEIGTTLSIKLDTVSSQANMCELEAKGKRVISSNKSINTMFAMSKDDADFEERRFEVVFTPKGAVIKTISHGAPVCGLNAYYDGKWSKDKVKNIAKTDSCKANNGDFKAITAVMKKDPDMGKVNKVYCPDIIENYARAVYDNNSDGGSAYLVKSNGKWKVLDFGTWIEVESLLELGIPKNIVEQLIK